MAERDNKPNGSAHTNAPERRAPFERRTRHIRQEPIDDTGSDYPEIDRHPALDQRRGTRRYMGTASSDPEYLPQTPGQEHGAGEIPPSSPIGSSSRRAEPLHYDRYLQLPNSGKAIFTSRQHRRRRRTHLALGVLIALSIALALLWYFFLR